MAACWIERGCSDILIHVACTRVKCWHRMHCHRRWIDKCSCWRVWCILIFCRTGDVWSFRETERNEIRQTNAIRSCVQLIDLELTCYEDVVVLAIVHLTDGESSAHQENAQHQEDDACENRTFDRWIIGSRVVQVVCVPRRRHFHWNIHDLGRTICWWAMFFPVSQWNCQDSCTFPVQRQMLFMLCRWNYFSLNGLHWLVWWAQVLTRFTELQRETHWYPDAHWTLTTAWPHPETGETRKTVTMHAPEKAPSSVGRRWISLSTVYWMLWTLLADMQCSDTTVALSLIHTHTHNVTLEGYWEHRARVNTATNPLDLNNKPETVEDCLISKLMSISPDGACECTTFLRANCLLNYWLPAECLGELLPTCLLLIKVII